MTRVGLQRHNIYIYIYIYIYTHTHTHTRGIYAALMCNIIDKSNIEQNSGNFFLATQFGFCSDIIFPVYLH
jgi:hypothetical protein